MGEQNYLDENQFIITIHQPRDIPETDTTTSNRFKLENIDKRNFYNDNFFKEKEYNEIKLMRNR